MKKYSLIPVMLLFSSLIFGQGIYNNGAKIVIGTGTTVNISGSGGNYRNETNITNGSVDLSGTLKIAGNVTNNVAAADILGTMAANSTVVFTGTALQTLAGTTTAGFLFPNFTINNIGGIVLSKNAQVNGAMTFTSGLVDIGTTNFTFGSLATIAGTPSATSMLVATGSGQVLRSWTGAGSFTFPVGDNTGTAEYSPVNLNFTAGAFAPGAAAGVNLVNSAFADPFISGSYLKRYWNVTQTGVTGFTCDAAFNYPMADVVGTENQIYGVKIIPAPISLYGPANTALHQLTAKGLTSFGTFTGALGQRTLNLTLFLEGLYKSGGMMNAAVDGMTALPKWGNTIADHITVELHDAANYLNIIYTINDIPLNTNGTATISFPGIYNGNYYVVIKHRNSLETVLANPMLFNVPTITYNMSDAAAKAVGGNLKAMAGGVFAIYAGDVSSSTGIYPAQPLKDGVVDLFDGYYVYSSFLNGDFGYLPGDVNGDGVVDLFDTYLVYLNFLTGIYAMKP